MKAMDIQAILTRVNELIGVVNYQITGLRKYQPGDRHTRTQWDGLRDETRITLSFRREPGLDSSYCEMLNFGHGPLLRITMSEAELFIPDQLIACYQEIEKQFPRTEDCYPKIYDLVFTTSGSINIAIKCRLTGFEDTIEVTSLDEIHLHYQTFEARNAKQGRVTDQNKQDYIDAINDILTGNYANRGLRCLGFKSLGRTEAQIKMLGKDGNEFLVYDVCIVNTPKDLVSQIIDVLDENEGDTLINHELDTWGG